MLTNSIYPFHKFIQNEHINRSEGKISVNENCWLKRMAIELLVGEAWEVGAFTHLANGIKRERVG